MSSQPTIGVLVDVGHTHVHAGDDAIALATYEALAQRGCLIVAFAHGLDDAPTRQRLAAHFPGVCQWVKAPDFGRVWEPAATKKYQMAIDRLERDLGAQMPEGLDEACRVLRGLDGLVIGGAAP